MKKKKIYGLIFLSFVVFSLFFSISLVSAENFWERWYKGTMDKLDAKILIFILTAIIILTILWFLGLKSVPLSVIISIVSSFILTSFVTPESVIGIFRSYDTVPLTIATILPLLLFFALTYISVDKESRTLMTLQLVAWWIFFFYLLFKMFLYIAYVWDWNKIPAISSLIAPAAGAGSGFSFPDWGTQEASFFMFALGIQILVAGIMAVANGWFMNIALVWTTGTKKMKVVATLKDIERGKEFLQGAGKIAETE